MQIQEFNFNNIQIKPFIDYNGNPWFKGNEIASILQYKKKEKAINDHVLTHNKKEYSLLCFKGPPNLGGPLNCNKNDLKTIYINEAGLYSLIMRSKMNQAIEFQEWVTSEVLPAIRKYGEYQLIQKQEQLAIEFETKLKLKQEELDNEKLERQKAERRSLRLKEKLIEERKKEENQVIYISTSESYAKQNRFKVGGVESISHTKGRMSTYNSRSAHGDEWYYCEMKKVHNYKAFEHRFWDVMGSFRDKRDKEMIVIHYHRLQKAFEFISNNYHEDIQFINENIRDFIDSLNYDKSKAVIPEKLNINFYQLVQVREGKVKKIELTSQELEPKLYETLKTSFTNSGTVSRTSIFEILQNYKFSKREAWRILKDVLPYRYPELKYLKINFK